MKVHFSQWLDGYIPHLPVGEAVMAEAWVGPRGLLERLESAFGIAGPASAEPERVDAYARRIERCVDGDVFFSRSWGIDPWGVARELLQWRDELVLAGWDGSVVADGGLRLEALAAVEAQREVELPGGFADRVRRVERVLEGGRETGIEEVRLIEPRRDLPCVWQRVIGALERSGTRIIEPRAPKPAADPGTDLGLLQRALVEGATTAGRQCPGRREPVAGLGPVAMGSRRRTCGVAAAARARGVAAPAGGGAWGGAGGSGRGAGAVWRAHAWVRRRHRRGGRLCRFCRWSCLCCGRREIRSGCSSSSACRCRRFRGDCGRLFWRR